MQDIILPEIVAIGIYDSRIAVKNRSITKNRKTTMFEIELPIEENGISFINEERMPISTNMLICAKPGQVRHSKLPFKCYYVHMIVPSGALYDMLLDIPNYVITEKVKDYRELFVKLCKYYETSFENDTIILQSIILELVYNLYRDSKRQMIRESMKQTHYEMINNTIKYIKEHLTNDLSLDTLAALASLSPIHFHNCFKSATGKTLHDYVEEQRIKKAITLLVTTDFTLTEIAYESGFSSQSYFSYVFKRRMNVTPREYVKELHHRYDS